jgi:vaccinia related kinase
MASKPKTQPKKASKKKNGYEMPKPLKPGDVLNDNQKNQWKVGVSIGVGGFGEIYSACKVGSNVKKVDDYPYVIKIVSSSSKCL